MSHIHIIAANEAAAYKKEGFLIDYKITVLAGSPSPTLIKDEEIKNWGEHYNKDMDKVISWPEPSSFNFLKSFVLDCIADDFVEIQQYNYFEDNNITKYEMTVGNIVNWDWEKLQQLYKDCVLYIECSHAPTMIIYFGLPLKLLDSRDKIDVLNTLAKDHTELREDIKTLQ